MDIDLNKVKEKIQSHFTDGLLVVVGCGLSSSEGMPGMTELANHLKTEIPKRTKDGELALWTQISSLLDKGSGIEDALVKCPPTIELEKIIVDATCELIQSTETKILNDVIKGTRTLRFSSLLRHLVIPNSGMPVVTTNYDRLIEVATEKAGIGVDTLFVGHHYGRLNEIESRMSFCRKTTMTNKCVYLQYGKRLILLKPHGSLDWYLCGDEPIRSTIEISQPRLIITPGLNKFRNGYERPFDTHREKANMCIDRASRFFVIGYGFNDDHLQTHLSAKIKEGKPTIILTQTLSDKAKKLVKESDNAFAITALTDTGKNGTQYIDKTIEKTFDGSNLWDLGVFVKEVLEP